MLFWNRVEYTNFQMFKETILHVWIVKLISKMLQRVIWLCSFEAFIRSERTKLALDPYFIKYNNI